MTDINRVFLVGRLTRDAELRFTATGTPVGKFSIAINRSKKSGEQWEEEVHYFDIVLWGKTAEALSKYLLKGKQVAIDGELRQNRWEQDGQSKSKVEIHATNIQLLGGSQGASVSSGQNASQGSGSYSKAPQGNSNFEKYGKEPFGDEPGGQFDDDGIPF